MKKFFLFIACAALVGTAGAAEPAKKPSFSGFVNNGFWDNWEISAGVGAGTAFSNGTNFGGKSERIGLEGDFSLTKWVNPVLGARLQLQGGKFSNFDQSSVRMKWPYVFVHADYMVNFSNWVGGYRNDRVYYAVPFLGFGYMAANFTDKAKTDSGIGRTHSFAMAYGLLNKFRACDAIDINLELKGLLVPSSVCPVEMSGSYLSGLTATVGVTYRFNKRTWERGVAGYTADDIRAFQDAVAAGEQAVAAAKADNERLSGELADARAQAAAAREAAAKAEKDAADARAAAKSGKKGLGSDEASAIFFDYGTSQLSARERTRLEVIADVIKKGPADRVYTIEGHADAQTGTPEGNKRVAENRARMVYEYLIKQGVDAKQLRYVGKGSSEDPFAGNQRANRSALLK